MLNKICLSFLLKAFLERFLNAWGIAFHTLTYICQLFLRYRHEIFILVVLRFLKTTRSFPKTPDEVRSLPKNPEVFRKRPKCQSQYKRELAPSAFHFKNQRSRERRLSFIHFTHGFRSLHGFELHIFGNCVKQDGNNSHFSIRCEKLVRRRE